MKRKLKTQSFSLHKRNCPIISALQSTSSLYSEHYGASNKENVSGRMGALRIIDAQPFSLLYGAFKFARRSNVGLIMVSSAIKSCVGSVICHINSHKPVFITQKNLNFVCVIYGDSHKLEVQPFSTGNSSRFIPRSN